MFGQTARDLALLRSRIVELESRLKYLEQKVGAEFRAGEWQPHYLHFMQDPRQLVSLHEVITKLMQHLGLTLKEHREVAYVFLEKTNEVY